MEDVAVKIACTAEQDRAGGFASQIQAMHEPLQYPLGRLHAHPGNYLFCNHWHVSKVVHHSKWQQLASCEFPNVPFRFEAEPSVPLMTRRMPLSAAATRTVVVPDAQHEPRSRLLIWPMVMVAFIGTISVVEKDLYQVDHHPCQLQVAHTMPSAIGYFWVAQLN